MYFDGFVYSILYIIYDGGILCNYLEVVVYLLLWGLWQIIALYFHDFFASRVESKVKKIHCITSFIFIALCFYLYFCNTSLTRLARTISDHHLKWNLVLCVWNHETHHHQLISPSGMVSLG